MSSAYYSKLINLIPSRKQFKSYAGSEGVAYFVSDKYVLKEYTKVEDWETFDRFFDLYCSEVQRFANSGMNIAKIYSWTKIPNIGYFTKGDKNKNSYFILEERVKGRELYSGYLEDSYMLVSDLCGEIEFKEAIKTDGSEELYREIIGRYISDYIQMNEFLESLSDNDLSKFLVDSYLMYNNGIACYPDMFPHNILVNDGSMKMIDMHMRDGESRGSKEIDSIYMRDVLGLFLYNSFPNMPEKYLLDKKFDFSDFESYSIKNRELTKRVIAKFFIKVREICGGSEMSRKDKSSALDMLYMMFGKDVYSAGKEIGLE